VYLTGEYPRATDTFIQREVASLRARGVNVQTCTVRRTAIETLTGPEQIREHAATFCILEAVRRPSDVLAALRSEILAAPARFARAARLALRLRPPGVKGLIWHLAYLMEAIILASHLRRVGAAHLHNHFADSSCTVALLAAAMAELPFSFTVHGPSEFFAAEHWRLDEKVARAAFVCCISAFCRSQLMVFSNPADWRKLHVVRCGVEIERYADAQAMPGDADRAQLLFVGRLAGIKGELVLLDAMDRIRAARPDVMLTIVGDGPGRARLEARIATLGLENHVRLTGAQSQADVARWMAWADVFVLPSFAEGLPIVLMEAMAARRAVVATRIAGIPELVEDGVNGFLVAASDVDALADRVERLLGDPDMRLAMGDAGRAKVVADHDVRLQGERLAALFAKKKEP
jgi:glycosyltransferase involved in cell wall biosynthesis